MRGSGSFSPIFPQPISPVCKLYCLVSTSTWIPVHPGGKPERQFLGLEQPSIPTDQPGETFTLQGSDLGWLQPGAPVFYRDIKVARMIDYQENGIGKPIIMHVFIHAPYDHYVRAATHFWNSSGLTASFGPSGLHVAVESLEALLVGGINFAKFEDAAQSPPATFETKFPLYNTSMRPRTQGSETIIVLLHIPNNLFPGLSRVQR